MQVRELRRIAGLSQAALAARSGIDRTRISFAENGYVELKPAEVQALQNVIAAEIQKQNARTESVLKQCGVAV